YADEANDDLVEIYNYIASDNMEMAKAFMAKMKSSIELLSSMPQLAPQSRYPELKALGIRVLVFEQYLIFYVINEDLKEVDIVRVRNGVTNYKNLFN
ncbi:MAG: type II toxin-antitoxin system RelE/ParE family toxin, partial [Clostridia bacterium]